MSEPLVLAADVGGTKSNLALCQVTPASLEIRFDRSYPNREFDSFEAVVRRFLADAGATAAGACCGVAGAVIDGACAMPNLGWRLSEAALAQDLGIGPVKLINDLEATALGIATLRPGDLHPLNPGRPDAQGNRALIAAGTGLGEALLFRDGTGYRVSASEGGHVDFGPNGDEQIALLRYLAAHFGHVSYERMVSGPGLVNIYRFLREDRGMEEFPGFMERVAGAADPAPAIAELGLARESAVCERALDLFAAVYGAAAGNLALKAMATGGLYVGGGIAPKLIDKIRDGVFMAAFLDKGRFRRLLTDVPVPVILEPKTALRGAAAHALACWD
ncbi:MAG: glucokinase [Pseudomonadota bacterium]|nr:glucokinase [Pseudomonadota bacterium]